MYIRTYIGVYRHTHTPEPVEFSAVYTLVTGTIYIYIRACVCTSCVPRQHLLTIKLPGILVAGLNLSPPRAVLPRHTPGLFNIIYILQNANTSSFIHTAIGVDDDDGERRRRHLSLARLFYCCSHHSTRPLLFYAIFFSPSYYCTQYNILSTARIVIPRSG